MSRSSRLPCFLSWSSRLFLLPVFFTPGQLVEEFEFTKVSLLVTGALILLAWWIAAESSRVGAAGFPRWLRALPGRILAAERSIAGQIRAGKDFSEILRCDEALRRKGAETFIPQLRALKLPPS